MKQNKMRRNELLFILLLQVALLMAVPAKREWRTITQHDGTALQVMLCGDEFHHYFKTTDDILLVRDAGGDFCYARIADGVLRSTGVRAHEATARTAAENAVLTSEYQLGTVRRQAPRLSAPHTPRVRRAEAFTGERRGLIILVSFSDTEFTSADAQAEWTAIVNEEGYSQHKARGSVSDFFRDQSDGRFRLSFDVVGPVQLPKAATYYGAKEDDPEGVGDHVGEMIKAACEGVDAQVDFNNYDWDGDKVADLVYVLYAGHGSNDVWKDPGYVWPHAFDMRGWGYWALRFDGVQIMDYACSNELNSSEQLTGIGTICHEFSHCFGLPYLYNTSTTKNVLGQWDLMDIGSYNGNGWCPPNHSAFERFSIGWATPVTLSEPLTVDQMDTQANGGDAYWFFNDANPNEYYIIENRQLAGWDSSLPGSGLLVTHVDYLESAWTNNTPNNTASHLRVGIVAANNRSIVSNAGGTNGNAAYPYNENDSLTDNSIPAAKWFTANLSGSTKPGLPVTEMKVGDDGLASFKFRGGSVSDGVRAITSDAHRLLGHPVDVYDSGGRLLFSAPRFSGLADRPRGLYILHDKTSGQRVKVIR